jgi:pimeloyl-ACP methyl ester carboxylesterase
MFVPSAGKRRSTLHVVTSKDGTPIAYDRQGHGPALILVAGALCSRLGWSGPHLSNLLAPHFSVYNYDRRGRGDSGDTKPYAVAREVEDIEALVDAAGGSAYLYGHSYGAALVLEAAIQLGQKIKKLALYEAPYHEEAVDQHAFKDYIQHLSTALAVERNGDAVAAFMQYVGMPIDQIAAMRQSPAWPQLESIAPTLAYDHTAILGEDSSIPTDRITVITAQTLIMYGGASFPFMQDTAQVLSKAMPHAKLLTLEGQTHDVAPEALAPVLKDFFLG